jgi:hypothetical protein|tara:strand:+ start:201 stop:563 length:363 start_codon:yes stop_codon:yes gene_type:complete
MTVNPKNINRYIFVLGSVLLLFFGGGALSIVWLRMEISTVAKNCGQLEGQMEVVGREVNQLRGQRSKSLRPATLAVMVEGRLAMPMAKNTFHVSKVDMNNRAGSKYPYAEAQRGVFAGKR